MCKRILFIVDLFNGSFARLKQKQAAVWQLLLQNHICGVQSVQQHPVHFMFVGLNVAFDLCWLSYSHQLYMHTAMYILYIVDLPKGCPWPRMQCPLLWAQVGLRVYMYRSIDAAVCYGKTCHSLCSATSSAYLVQQLSMKTETHMHVEPGGQ